MKENEGPIKYAMEAPIKYPMLIVLFAALVLVVVVQAFFMMKLARSAQQAEPATESVQIDLQPDAGPGQPPTATPPNWNTPLPMYPPLGAFGNPGTWDPLQEFRGMRQQMDQIFNDSLGRFQQSPDFESLWGTMSFSPNMDVEENNGNYIVRMDLPGADKANISVNIDDRKLVVSGKIDETTEEQGKNQLRKERRSGEFKRELTLPGPVKSDEMEAKYEKGVLTITLPKAAKDQIARKIEIK
jgi:HSP20 family protein